MKNIQIQRLRKLKKILQAQAVYPHPVIKGRKPFPGGAIDIYQAVSRNFDISDKPVAGRARRFANFFGLHLLGWAFIAESMPLTEDGQLPDDPWCDNYACRMSQLKPKMMRDKIRDAIDLLKNQEDANTLR